MDLKLVRAATGLHEAYNRYTSEGKVTAYVSPVGETILENFAVGRRNRPYQDWKPVVLEFLEAMTGIDDLKLRWSQKAGCSCGCSPGFHVKRIVDGDIEEPLRPRHIAQALEPKRGRHQGHYDARHFDPWRWVRGYDLDIYLSISADAYVTANRGMIAASNDDDDSGDGGADDLLERIADGVADWREASV